MKKLTEEEISKLSKEEKWSYWDKLRKHEWLTKSFEERKAVFLSDMEFLFSRGDIGQINLFEEKLDIANATEIDENQIIKYYGIGFFNDIRVLRERYGSVEEFTYFWATKSPFSQWHKSNFTATTFLLETTNYKKESILEDAQLAKEQEYNSAEQFMMYHKAMTFLDIEVAKKIMSTTDVGEIKKLGRHVSGFNEQIWQYYRTKVVYEGNKAKFNQNLGLQGSLIETMGTSLVEAAPNDRIWGIGLAEDDPRAQKRETWQGKNLLGEILTQIRIELVGEY